MGVKFVTPKGGDAVAVVTRSVESPEEVLDEATGAITPPGESGAEMPTEESVESPDVVSDATIEGEAPSDEVTPE